MQDVVAPFVLENLNCSGTETTLLECPGARPPADIISYSDYTSYPEYTYNYLSLSNPAACDPLEGTYAFVACGMTDGPGTISHTMYSKHSQCTCGTRMLMSPTCTPVPQ